MLRRFDGIAEDGRQFLVNLQHEIRRNLSIQGWIETVWAQFTDQASEWINNEKEMMVILDKESPIETDKKRFVQLICEKYPVVRKPVVSCEQYSVQKFAVSCEKYPIVKKTPSKHDLLDKLRDVKQGKDETIREYYQRFNNLFVEAGGRNDVNKYDLEYEELLLLSKVIENWVQGLNNKKLRRRMCSRYLISNSLQAQSLFGAYTTAERQQKEIQKALQQQQLQDFVDRDVARIQKSHESPPILEEMPCDLSETSTVTSTAIVDTSDTELTDEVLASGPGKWIAADAGKEVFDSTSTPAGPSKNQPAPHVKKHIEAVVVDTDTESTDEVLASGPGKWIAAAAGKEVFGYSSTSDEAAKNPTEASDNSFGWSRCCTVDDVEVLNQEVFALAALYDTFLKNPPAEDMEISVAMDMPSLKHLMDMDGPVIEAFDSGTTLGAHSKNPSMQHTDVPETTEKTSVSAFTDFASDSAHTPYELPALPAFDLSIDIDFETYTFDIEASTPVTPPRRKLQLSPFRGLALRNTSFVWSRCCTNPVASRPSVATCTSVSDVTSVEVVDTKFCEGEQLSCSTMNPSESDTDFYEGEQSLSSCSVDSSVSASVDVISTSEDIDFYGGEQSSCSTNAVCTFVVVVNTHAALTLTVGMVMKKPARMSFPGPIKYLAPKPKHKGLPKVKIKGY